MNLQEQLVQFRRQLHKYPELSMKEFKTTEKIKKWLSQAGVKVLDIPDMKVGAAAEVRGKFPGETIVLRADIDALPIEECTGLDFSSENHGVMHACGHDFHTAVMIGAAMLLEQRKEQLHGCVRFLFQPSEENAQGAKWMAGFGVLEGVSAIFGFHNRPDLPVGTVGVKEGALMAGVSRFEILVKGRGGHAGMPENCIDPIAAGAQIVTALQTIVSRKLSPLENAVLSITRFNSGNTWNVIPSEARIEGTVRTLQKGATGKIAEQMKKISEGIAAANGASAELNFSEYLPVLYNEPRFTKAVKKAAEIEHLTVAEALPNLGGEDFSYYQSLIPGYFVWIGVEGKEDWHSPGFIINENALEVGARYFARLGEEILKK